MLPEEGLFPDKDPKLIPYSLSHLRASVRIASACECPRCQTPKPPVYIETHVSEDKKPHFHPPRHLSAVRRGRTSVQRLLAHIKSHPNAQKAHFQKESTARQKPDKSATRRSIQRREIVPPKRSIKDSVLQHITSIKYLSAALLYSLNRSMCPHAGRQGATHHI